MEALKLLQVRRRQIIGSGTIAGFSGLIGDYARASLALGGEYRGPSPYRLTLNNMVLGVCFYSTAT